MGYAGLDSWVDSDNTFDMTSDIIEGMCESLNTHLKENSNSYNTCGAIDVALFFESFILPIKDEIEDMEFVTDLASETSQELKKLIEAYEKADWNGDEDNKNMHITSCKRMLSSLSQIYDE